MAFSLIGVLLVLRWRLDNPSILEIGHFPSVTDLLLEHLPPQPLHQVYAERFRSLSQMGRSLRSMLRAAMAIISRSSCVMFR